jgi:hypothetical protein
MLVPRGSLACAGFLLLAGRTPAVAQDVVLLREAFPSGYQYHVSTRVDVAGTLSLPPDKNGTPSRPLPVTGDSAIEYDERILDASADGDVRKTLRIYRRIDFHRRVAERPQESTIRSPVRRLVILRLRQAEVPFSPDGPLTWGEIDLVRTDVFTPALVGLLPERAVRPGDRWTATTLAVQELTDMERIDDGRLECRFEEVSTLAGRRYARVALAGSVRGLNEDGPNRQQLDGYYFFDLQSNHLSYLTFKGVNALLDKDGKVLGSVEGQFVLTRRPQGPAADLSDEALRGIGLEPTAENTELLYDNPDLGIRFLHPRRWRVGAVRGTQLTLDETNGSGLLLTVEPADRVPTVAQYLAESRDFLEKQKMRVLRMEAPRRVAAVPEVDTFALETEASGQRVLLEYYVSRQPSGGMTLAARLLPADLPALRREVERIARSVQLGRK